MPHPERNRYAMQGVGKMNKHQQMKKEAYQKMVEEISPKSEKTFSMIRAFLVGGLICAIGQGISDIGKHLMLLDDLTVPMFTSVVLIFLGATLTGLGVYDKIGKFAGGGSIVPITGFANSIVAPAMEYKREGFVMGVGAKMFTIAGPVLVYGTIASIAFGLIYFFFGGLFA